MLGRFCVEAGGRTVIDDSWSHGKARAIVKLLALEGAPLSRDQVADVLWPESDAAAAANSLRQSLHQLRATFAESGLTSPVESAGGHLALRPDVWTDVREFRGAAWAARAARRDIVLYERAIDLYDGDFLPHDLYEHWAQGPREHLKVLHLRLLSELADLCRAEGRCETAEELLQQVLQADPVREAEHRMLMRVYMHCGRRAEAVRQYQVCRDILGRELGAEPSAETEAVYREVLSGGNGDVSPASATPVVLRSPDNGRQPDPGVGYATTSDGVSIAYWTLGKGPPLLLAPRLPFSHIEAEWRIPEHATWYQRLAQGRTLIRYDPRGAGLSSRSPDNYSLESLELDIQAVADELQLRHFDLISFGHSCPVAIDYATRNPDRLGKLLLWCPYARGRDFRPDPRARALRAMMREDWVLYTETAARVGLGWSGDQLAPQLAALMRDSVEPDMAERAFRTIDRFDVLDDLGRLSMPTLVLLRDGVPEAEAAEARLVAAQVANARLCLFEGQEAVPFLGNVDAILEAIDEFLRDGNGALPLASFPTS